MPKSDKSSSKLTPMMRQYQTLRKSLPDDALLFFRLGDFYELFFDDAKKASEILNLTLTKRNGVPMCGVPHHAAAAYINKLVAAGTRVAIAEQTTQPQAGKIVDRDIVRVISAGTVDDASVLDDKRTNYIAAIFSGKKGRFGLAWLELTTGEFFVTEVANEQELADKLSVVQPAEILVADDEKVPVFGVSSVVTKIDGYLFFKEQAEQMLVEHFSVKSLDGFGVAGLELGISAAGAIVHHLKYQMRNNLEHVRRLLPVDDDGRVGLDAATQANLELTQAAGGRTDFSLLGVMDATQTAMGGRLLREWLLSPLSSLEALLARQEAVAAFRSDDFLLAKLRDGLREVRDIERTAVRLARGGGNGRDLAAIAGSLANLPDLLVDFAAVIGKNKKAKLIEELLGKVDCLEVLVADLAAALVDEPPVAIQEGGIFCEGYNAKLDELRTAATDGKQWMVGLQAREIEATGIKSLKVKYNAVFGYFIEVTKSNLAAVPEYFVRRQTTAGGERYVTTELKEMEEKILGADEQARKMEYELFCDLRGKVILEFESLQTTAKSLAELDVLMSFADLARRRDYCRPLLSAGKELVVESGRHPVLDVLEVEKKFVPNDTVMNGKSDRMQIITGPNMAGKSTYIRQVALLTLMAQIGSFVPAKSMKLGLVDRIFSRVGASDDLTRGQSTFMVEMCETAAILHNASDKSLVILDEIGRGTATYDGLAIAWAVAEHLLTAGCRVLFATHYHELTAMVEDNVGVKNMTVAVREWRDKIVFLHQIVPGTAGRSYGVHVAKLAGLPDSVTVRAEELLEKFENKKTDLVGKQGQEKGEQEDRQLFLFE